VLEACNVTGNVADTGGGMQVHAKRWVMLDSSITANVATNGGGLFMGSGALSVSGCALVGNAAIAGSAVLANQLEYITLVNSTTSMGASAGGAEGEGLWSDVQVVECGKYSFESTAIQGLEGWRFGRSVSSFTHVVATGLFISQQALHSISFSCLATRFQPCCFSNSCCCGSCSGSRGRCGSCGARCGRVAVP